MGEDGVSFLFERSDNQKIYGHGGISVWGSWGYLRIRSPSTQILSASFPKILLIGPAPKSSLRVRLVPSHRVTILPTSHTLFLSDPQIALMPLTLSFLCQLAPSKKNIPASPAAQILASSVPQMACSAREPSSFVGSFW